MEKQILIIDDDKSMRSALRRMLELNNISVIEAAGGREALEELEKETPSVILLDVKMPGIDGIELLPHLKKKTPHVPIIMLTAHGDVPMAVQATKLGAYDFILKPAPDELLLQTIHRAHEKHDLETEKSRLEIEVTRLNSAVDMSLEWQLGRSDAMRSVIEQVHQVGWSNFSLIIQGETGSGKSLLANLIHNLSKGVDKPFIRVDIGALPEALVESELFGHEKGAFTGANRKKKGYFEMADSGTLFIDELENISPYMQSKLLGVVEQKKVCPVGGTTPVEIDVRIIAATNRDIKQCVFLKEFREDLFYRLGEFIIEIPPLRQRPDDIPYFAERFLGEVAEEIKKPAHEISEEACSVLSKYSWPGNVRELKNTIRRAALVSPDGIIRPENINFLGGESPRPGTAAIIPLKELSSMVVRDAEIKAIRQALTHTDGNKTRAAALLKIDYTTLFAKMKLYDIK
jgi:DNA-binding NtrC family response regulator